jgi:Uma2 family endonuclease
MHLALNNKSERWSYADYLSWDDGKRWELINGVVYPLSSTPGTLHQRVSGGLLVQFGNYFVGRTSEVFCAPFDVCLIDKPSVPDNEITTVVEPDLIVICDRTMLDERCCMGVPDLLVEILTAESAAHDLKTKFDLYQHHGVREYWIVHPKEQTVMVFKIEEDGMYGKPERYAGDDTVPVPLFGDLVVDLKGVFAE